MKINQNRNDVMQNIISLVKFSIRSKAYFVILMLFVAYGMRANNKKIYTTNDMADNVWKTLTSGGTNPGQYFTDELAEVFQKLKQKKIDRVYWIYSANDSRYCFLKDRNSNYFWGIAGVQKAAAIAHANGLEFYAVFKPFESGSSTPLPASLSLYPGNERLSYMGGYIIASDFAVQNPHMRLKRKPVNDNGNSIKKIILYSQNDQSGNFNASNVKVFTATENGSFTTYTGTFTISELLVSRNGKNVMSLVIDNLDISNSAKYVLIKYDPAGTSGNGEFQNDPSCMIECYDAQNQQIIVTHNVSRISRSNLISKYQRFWLYRNPQQPVLPASSYPSSSYGTSIETTAYLYGIGSSNPVRQLNCVDSEKKNGYISFARGKNEYLPGLHPAYPEVRTHWLNMIQSLIDAGCDGIDIRISSHSTWTQEGKLYGFNTPVVNKYQTEYSGNILSESITEYDDAKLREIQGVYFTLFLIDAANLVHNHNKEINVHINYQMLNNYRWKLNDVPANFKWQWRKWIKQNIVDGVTLKYLPWCFDNTTEDGKKYAETIGTLAQAYNIPVFVNARLVWWMALTPAAQAANPFTTEDYELVFNRTKWAYEQPWSNGANLYELNDYALVDQRTSVVNIIFSDAINTIFTALGY